MIKDARDYDRATKAVDKLRQKQQDHEDTARECEIAAAEKERDIAAYQQRVRRLKDKKLRDTLGGEIIRLLPPAVTRDYAHITDLVRQVRWKDGTLMPIICLDPDALEKLGEDLKKAAEAEKKEKRKKTEEAEKPEM